jgi:hypothetical protein
MGVVRPGARDKPRSLTGDMHEEPWASLVLFDVVDDGQLPELVEGLVGVEQIMPLYDRTGHPASQAKSMRFWSKRHGSACQRDGHGYAGEGQGPPCSRAGLPDPTGSGSDSSISSKGGLRGLARILRARCDGA